MTAGPVSDDMLMAYADGELEDREAAMVKRAVAGDAALSAKLGEFETTPTSRPPSIDAFLDSTGADGPLDGKAEAEYRKQKWQIGR